MRAELEVFPGCVESFLELARSLGRAAGDEDGTLRYAWFQSPDEAPRFVVLEEYTDPAAALAHNEHCAELLAKVADVAQLTSVQLHGELSPELEAWVAQRPGGDCLRPATALAPASTQLAPGVT